MKCVNCGYDMIWNSDFDTEDIGLDTPGVVSYYTCSNWNNGCYTEIELTTFNEEPK